MAKRETTRKPSTRRTKAAAGESADHADTHAAPAAGGPDVAAPEGAAKPRARAGKTVPSRPDTPQLAIELARSMHDDKCSDIVVLDVRGKSPITDFVVIGSGTSDRQMHAVIQNVRKTGDKLGHTAWRSDADEQSTWLLADFVDVIVHVFEPNIRAHYDLEMLWGDAKRVEWERPEAVVRNRAGLRAGEVTFDH
ncbi:MAG: ribosome silencing factor [Phycisphaerales bacterium]|jgi:ribosome-associated protein|nr:ribosome silencing factor [Phycisphaerales bacterium]